jgi:hypothetical protein
MSFPDDVWGIIMQKGGAEVIGILARTCKRLNVLSNKSFIWRNDNSPIYMGNDINLLGLTPKQYYARAFVKCRYLFEEYHQHVLKYNKKVNIIKPFEMIKHLYKSRYVVIRRTSRVFSYIMDKNNYKHLNSILFKLLLFIKHISPIIWKNITYYGPDPVPWTYEKIVSAEEQYESHLENYAPLGYHDHLSNFMPITITCKMPWVENLPKYIKKYQISWVDYMASTADQLIKKHPKIH